HPDLHPFPTRRSSDLASDAGAERGDERADLLARQHLVFAHTLDVEYLAAQGQDRLERAVASLLGGAASRIALNDEELGLGRILLLAIGQFPRKRRDAERVLADDFARFSRGLARRGGLDHLADDNLGLGRMLLEPGLERIIDDALDHRPDLGGDELVL